MGGVKYIWWAVVMNLGGDENVQLFMSVKATPSCHNWHSGWLITNATLSYAHNTNQPIRTLTTPTYISYFHDSPLDSLLRWRYDRILILPTPHFSYSSSTIFVCLFRPVAHPTFMNNCFQYFIFKNR